MQIDEICTRCRRFRMQARSSRFLSHLTCLSEIMKNRQLCCAVPHFLQLNLIMTMTCKKKYFVQFKYFNFRSEEDAQEDETNEEIEVDHLKKISEIITNMYTIGKYIIDSRWFSHAITVILLLLGNTLHPPFNLLYTVF
jgi:hypothetical protein